MTHDHKSIAKQFAARPVPKDARRLPSGRKVAQPAAAQFNLAGRRVSGLRGRAPLPFLHGSSGPASVLD